LQQPAYLPNGQAVKSAKLKGVGLCNPVDAHPYPPLTGVSHSSSVQKPSTEEFLSRRQSWHFGFTASGEFELEHSAAAPIGGMLHSRAEREFQAASELYQQNVPVTVPLAVVKYDNMTFQGNPMGAVVTLGYDPYPFRCSNVIFGCDAARKPLKHYCDSLLDRLCGGAGEDKARCIDVLTTMASKFGQRMRAFSSCGLYRHSGGLDNFLYSESCNAVILTDLDSSRPLSELSDNVKVLQILRDLGSVLYKFIDRFSHPIVLSRFQPADLLAADPLAAALVGFFGDHVSSAAKEISAKLSSLWLVAARSGESFGHSSRGETALQCYVHSNMDLFYAAVIVLTFPLLQQCDLAEQYPYSLTSDHLMRLSENLLHHRLAGLRFLLDYS
jgi:hypothetical protein